LAERYRLKVTHHLRLALQIHEEEQFFLQEFLANSTPP
jgi:hypothetical protein